MGRMNVIGLLCACLLAMLLSSCSLDAWANDSEKERLAQLDEQRVALDAELDGLDDRAQGALEELAHAETKEQAEQLVGALATTLNEYDAKLLERRAIDEERAAIETAIVDRTFAPPLKGLLPFLPPWAQIAVGGAGAWLGALLLGPRSREHVLSGLRDMLRGKVDQALSSILKKAPGFFHTNKTSEELLGALEYVARQEGRDDVVMGVRAVRETTTSQE